MRIGIDARELSGRATGVGRFLNGLLREWASAGAGSAHEFVLYSPEPLPPGIDSRRFRTRTVAGAAGTWWEQVHLPRALADDRLDLFFAPAYTAPLRVQVPTVAAIYDLSYVAHPEWFRLREGIRRRWLTERTAASARAIITLSEFSRREIVERLGVPADRVRTIVPGIDRPIGHPSQSTAAEPRILFVGSLFNRRHVLDLVRAAAIVARTRPDVSLDIVGDDRTFPREDLEQAIRNAGLEGRARWHRFASDEALADLYGRARAFAFLSEYEGLGLTPLEALAAGVPPVLYDTPVARESCGDAAVYVPIGDLPGVVRALERTLFDSTTRRGILDRAPATLARYEWPRAARDTIAVFESVV
jgi:glycosyltransferase involved in cell wall biosynthesis